MASAVSPIVLVVEDEEDARETLRELLELRGYNVRTAADGQQALDAIDSAELPICIVLLDLFMPNVDGWAVYETLQTRGQLESLRVLITTSAPHRAPAGSSVMGKPLDLSKLFELLQSCC
ncbi:MAG TPA: response regulator [Kofleriaceae bacterium]|nr:response regulator [Kofleriaceae bacterium]